jgi:hypothetical protein
VKKILLLSLLFSLPAIAMNLTKMSLAPSPVERISFKGLTKKMVITGNTQSMHYKFYNGSDLVAESKYTIDDNEPGTVELNFIQVTSAYRNQGIGYALSQNMFQEIATHYPNIKEARWLCLPLDKETDFDKLCAFYRNLGAFIDEHNYGSFYLQAPEPMCDDEL